MFKLHPIFLSLLAAQGVFVPLNETLAATLKPFSPYVNDNKAGVFCVCNGSTQTLSGNQRFAPGLSGAQSLTLRELQSQVSNPDISLALAPGLDPGGRDYAIDVPDWEQGGYKTVYVYNSKGMTETAPLGLDTPLPNYVQVKGGQYINTRVAQVSKGTINVDIGQKGAATTAETNGWSMAAKQSRLFTATGSGNMNWNSANRLTFTAELPPYGGPYLTYDVDNVAFYKGAFSVTTTDNVTTDFNVTSFEEFKSYNDWLISQLERSRLDPDSYSAELDKAVTITSGQIVYGKVLQDYDDDEAAQPIGELVVLSADGKKATARVNGTLEVANASSAVLAANGATAIINGKVSSTSNGSTEGDALSLTGGSTGINKGVINGGFFNNASGTGVESSSVGRGVNAVRLLDKSRFTNSGVINVAGSGTGLAIFDGSATNNGNINVGVSDYSSSASGVFVNGEGTSFVNAASGTIYLGRSPQNGLKDKTTDTRVYNSVGINMVTDGSVVNQGRIVIGSLTQSSIAMQVQNGPNARLQNSGVIDVNGRDNLQPEENVAMSVIDSGTGGRVGNSGTINLNGDNGTGLKVIATSGNQSRAYSDGTINVTGNADALNGDWNTAVWAKGEQDGEAYARVTGKINLTGTGAVGARAEGNARIDLAQPISLQNAPYQIGYWKVGENAKINYGGSNIYGTYGKATHSTVFRVEDGADFTSDGLTIEPHTAYSIGVAASGSGSVVSTSNMAFDIGENATGITIANGAQGVLKNGSYNGESRPTTLHFSGDNATGAVVDGEGSTLISNASITDELRSNGGELGVNNGDGSRIPVNEIGLLATNKASLTNTGRINLYGDATAIRAESGATVNNSARITIWSNSVGLYAKGNYDEGDGVTPTVITNTGIVDLSRLVYPSIGVVADGPLAQIYQNGNIYISDRDAVGGKAINGGKIFVGDAGTVEFSYSSDGQTGYWADGSFSTLTSNGGKTTIYDTASTVYRLTNGAWFESTNPAEINLSWNGSVGIDASGDSYIAATDIFNISRSATAIKLSSGSDATITNPITMDDGATAVSADGQYTSVYNISTISGAGTAYDLSNGATASLAQGSSVNLTGSGSTAFRVTNGGAIFNQGYANVANGIGIDVIGGRTQYFPESAQIQAGGTAAVRVGANSSFAVYGDGTFRNQITGTNGADAFLLEKGASGLYVEGTTVTAEGGGSAIDNRAETSDISLVSTYIYARGEGSSGIRSATSLGGQSSFVIEPSNGATGYLFANADGSTTRNDLVSNGTILAGSGSDGIRANTTGKVISEGNVYVTTESGGSAIVTSTASEVVNRGEIFSWSTQAPVIDLRGGTTTFINEGTIGAQYPDTVIVAGGATGNQIALIGGAVVGDVNTGEGTDTVALTGGTINGSLTMGSGVDNRAYVQNVSLADVSHITTAGGAGSTLSLSEIAASGGSFASDDLSRGVNLGAGWSTISFYNTDWTLTDNLKLAHSTINIDAASTLSAGDNVDPVLEGATGDSLVVNNAGTLDLTNGAGLPGDVLTINGTLNSLYGTLKLNSALNGGGALGSQSSDTLRVNGDANGVSLIEVVPSTGSTGAFSDANQNGIIEASEGVSLMQVSGSAGTDSFTLKGGYLAAGPWRYDLYSFAPGSSDAAQRLVDGSGNQFWDYRLANGIVSNGGSSRAALVPQVPSYISAPVGLAYYSAATLNDLHNRLGELRQSQQSSEAIGSEMFLRYTGANMRYSTSRNFNDFGYNFDMDYSAMQVGGNVLQLDGANGTLRGGVAYTRGNSRIRPDAADGYSSTAFDSDTLSLYSTWLQESGFYLDGTLSYSWHRGETDIARQKDVAKIKGKGWSASLESGYPFELGSGLRLEPQAQLTYLHLGLDNFSDKDNLAVSYDDYNQTIGRVGAKLDRRWSDDSGRQYTPYLRANYYKGWGSQAKTSVGAKGVDGLDQTFRSGKFGQMWETGLGGTVTFRNNLSLYAEADYRKEIDGNGGKGWGYNAGVRWTF